VPSILQGDLQHFRPGELLALFGEKGHAGTLRVEAEGRAIEIVLKEGKVLFARAADARGKEAVLELFTWPAGTFTFIDDATLPDGAVATPLETSELIEDGEAHADMFLSKRKLYPDDAIVRPIDNPARQENISLTPDALKVLLGVAGGRTMKQLCTDLGRDASDVYPIVQSLETAELVRIERQAATTEMEPIILPKKTSPGGPQIASLTGGTTAEVWPLLEDEYSVGRVETNAIVINDTTISSRHARIIRNGDGFWLEDLQSRNGTYVNGDRVTSKRLLADRDVIRFGRITLTFNIASEMVSTTTAAGSAPT
jgi:hypothetical protein